MSVMAAENCEQRHLVLLYQGLVIPVVEYALVILTRSHKQAERLEIIQNDGMRFVHRCTTDTAWKAMRSLPN